MTEAGGTAYRCGSAARWLPRTMAVAVLVAGLLAVARVDPDAGVPGTGTFRILLVAAAAVAALWVVRKGAEVRLQVSLQTGALVFERGIHRVELPLDAIDAIGYEPPFGASRSWLPAAVLVDRDGDRWRLSALLGSGERLVEEIVGEGGRESLRAWASAHRVPERMARSALRVRIGYVAALAVALAPAALWLL